jgi:hypothetical protein
MPNRILRDGFVDSESVAGLTDWSHRLYSNLLVKCDDAGRFDGRVEMLRSHLFPLGTSRRVEDFNKALAELEKARLVIRYERDGRAFLQVTKWQRCGNSECSRFPWLNGDHAISYVDKQTRDGPKRFVSTSLFDPMLMASVPHAEGVKGDSDTETKTDTKTKTPPRTGAEVPAALNTPEFVMAWGCYLRHRDQMKDKLTDTAKELALKKLSKMGVQRAVACIEHSVSNSWVGLHEPKGVHAAKQVNGAAVLYRKPTEQGDAERQQKIAGDYLGELIPEEQDMLMRDYKAANGIDNKKPVTFDNARFRAWLFDHIQNGRAA